MGPSLSTDEDSPMGSSYMDYQHKEWLDPERRCLRLELSNVSWVRHPSCLGDFRLRISAGKVAMRRQCSITGAGDPSVQLPTQTIKIVTRSSGSFAAIIGEPGWSAPQLSAAEPETKNIKCGCQFMPRSFKYCCFDIM